MLPKNRLVTNSLSIGFGASNVLDTYISPLDYSGIELRLVRDRFRMTNIMNGKVGVQYSYSIYGSRTENISKSATEWTGMGYLSLGYFYNPNERHSFGVNGLTVMYGPQLEIGGGAVYNKRNSNNPANGRVYFDVKASAIAKYSVRLFNVPFLLRDQTSVPLLGVMFSPEYQQSYYEIFSLGQSKGVVKPTTLVSKPSFRNQFSVDVPVGNSTLRLSYLLELDQTKVNNLKYHSYSNLFMVGYVKQLYRLRRKDKLGK